METWRGAHESGLFQVWGPPQETATDGLGGKIHIYYASFTGMQQPGRAVRNYDGSVSYTAPTQTTTTQRRMFFVDSTGTIYGWKIQ